MNGSVDLVVLDSDGGDDREEKALANARRAAEDDAALAYLGDFYSDQVQVTSPILHSTRTEPKPRGFIRLWARTSRDSPSGTVMK